jgi:IS30 family transposase
MWTRKPKIDLLELVTLRESGLTTRAIAARLGVGKTTIVRGLKRTGGI